MFFWFFQHLTKIGLYHLGLARNKASLNAMTSWI